MLRSNSTFLLLMGFIFAQVFLGQALATQVRAADFKVPALTGPVMDEVGVLDPSTRQELESLLRSLNQKSKVQLQVLVVDSLQGLPIENASIQIVDQWQLGDKKKDNGVLFLVSISDRKLRIEVGQGLEGELTDLKSKHITADVVKPLFKAGRYSDGIRAGVYSIVATIDPEILGAQASEWKNETTDRAPRFGKKIEIFFFLILILGMFLKSLFAPRTLGRRSRYYGGWGGGGSGWGGGSGGGGSWSGGGGGFSGGGSSDSW